VVGFGRGGDIQPDFAVHTYRGDGIESGIRRVWPCGGRCVLFAGYVVASQGATSELAAGARAVITSLGVVIGFPLFSSIAMHSVPASHGAVVLGMLPLATALFGALRFGERPSLGFWIAALAGTAIVIAFALQQGGGGLQLADLALFAAVLAAAMGYAEGGRLAQTMGGQQVICWALVLSLPLLLPVSIWLGWRYGVDASPRVWLAFAYVSLFSMFIGFFFWYKGLALGGIARVGQVQLLQPFMSLLGAALIAGEVLEARNLLFATAVIVVVAMGRKMSIRR